MEPLTDGVSGASTPMPGGWHRSVPLGPSIQAPPSPVLPATSAEPTSPELDRPPLAPAKWYPYFQRHPDATFAEFILRGLHHGLRIGAHTPEQPHSFRRNHRSAFDHPEEVTRYIQAKTAAGRLRPATAEVHTHCSPWGSSQSPASQVNGVS